MPCHDLVILGVHFGILGALPDKKTTWGSCTLHMTQTRLRSRKGYVGSFVRMRSKTATWGVQEGGVINFLRHGHGWVSAL